VEASPLGTENRALVGA